MLLCSKRWFGSLKFENETLFHNKYMSSISSMRPTLAIRFSYQTSSKKFRNLGDLKTSWHKLTRNKHFSFSLKDLIFIEPCFWPSIC